MKRTLALFLTLCMALSMFSFPAFAAEADVAVLDEAALVETETTPAPTEDVVAPVAADESTVAVTADITDETAKNQSVVFDGDQHPFAAIDASKFSIQYTDKDNALQTYDVSGGVKIEYFDVLTNAWSENVPTKTWKNAGSEGVRVRVTPTAAVPEGFDAWGSAEVACTFTIEPFPVNMTSTTAAIADAPDRQFDAEWDLPALNIELNGEATHGAVLAEMGAPALKFYTDKTLTTEIPADELNQHVGTVYVTAQLASSGNWTFNANNGLLGATGGLSFTIHPNDTVTPEAKFSAASYDALYTGAAITDAVAKENVAFTGEYADKEVKAVTFTYSSKNPTGKPEDYTSYGDTKPQDLGTYFVKATVTNTDYFTKTATAYAKIVVKKGSVKVTMPAKGTEYGYTGAAVDYAAGITYDPANANGLVEVKYVGLGTTVYAESTTAPTLPGSYRATVTAVDSANVTLTGTTTSEFKIVPKTLDGSLSLGTSFSGTTVGDLATAAEANLTKFFAGTNSVPQTADAEDADWTLTGPDGKIITWNTGSSDTLTPGVYNIKAVVAPKTQVDNGRNYTTFLETTFTYNYTKTGAGTTVYMVPGLNAQDVSLVYDGKAYDVNTLLAKAYGDNPVAYQVGTAATITTPATEDITDQFDKYKIVLVAEDESGNWVPVDSVTNVGTYYIAAMSTAADGKLAADLDANGIKVDITKQYLLVEYNPVVVEYDKKDHKADLTVAAFTGKTADGKTIAITEENCKPDAGSFITWGVGVPAQLTDVGEYGFTANFTFDNYKDATVTGALKIVGVGNVTVQFKQRSYSSVYNGNAQRVTANDYTIKNADPAAVTGTTVWYTDAAGKVTSSEPKAAGVYTAHVKVPSVGNKNEATDEVPFEIKKADAKLTWNNAALRDDTLTFSDNIKSQFDAALQHEATIAGVKAGDPTTATVTYKFYRDGVLLTEKNAKGEDVPATLAQLTAEKLLPGVYTATAEWVNEKEVNKKIVPEDANYNAIAPIISNKVTVKSGALDSTKVPQFNTLADPSIAYGDVIEGHKLGTVAANGGAGTVAGTFYTTGKGQVTATGKQIFTVMFQPSEGAYEPAVVGLQEIDVKKAVLNEKDVKITNTEVAAYDGKEYALTGAEVVNKKFAADEFTIKYSATRNGNYNKDINSVKYSKAGSNIVWVEFSSDNYDNAYFPGYVAIGVAKSTLAIEDVTAPYEFSTKPVQPKVTITTETGKVVTVDPKYLDYSVGAYEEDKDLTSYTPNMLLQDAHVVENGYWVKAEVKDEALVGDLSSYYLGDGVVVYGRYTVTKADLDESLLPSSIDSKTEVYKDEYGKKATLADLNLKASNDPSSNKEDLKVIVAKANLTGKEYTGNWAWVNNEQKLTPSADFTAQFTPTGRGGKEATDYNLPTAKVNVVVTPEKIANLDGTTVPTDVTWTPEKAPYGLTLGDIEVTGLDKVTVTSAVDGELKGTWVWEKGNDFVAPVTDTKTNPNGDVYYLIFAADANPSCYDAKIPVTITIEKAEPVITVTNTTMAYTGNPASLRVESNNTEADPTLTWYDAKGNTMAGAPTQIGKYKVKVSLPETKSFKAGSVTVDYEITYNQTGIEGFVYRLYSVALGREPEQEGYTKWVNGMKSKEYTPEFVSYGFIFSKEFINKKYDNATFLKIMYSTFMDREPDASGYNMWLKGLNSGEFSREDVFQGFVKSREFTNICARYGL